MGREENVSIFEDTKKMVKNNKTLAEAVKWSTKNQVLVPEYMEVKEFWEEWDPDDEFIDKEGYESKQERYGYYNSKMQENFPCVYAVYCSCQCKWYDYGNKRRYGKCYNKKKYGEYAKYKYPSAQPFPVKQKYKSAVNQGRSCLFLQNDKSHRYQYCKPY